jgi:hypothetical protein
MCHIREAVGAFGLLRLENVLHEEPRLTDKYIWMLFVLDSVYGILLCMHSMKNPDNRGTSLINNRLPLRP